MRTKYTSLSQQSTYDGELRIQEKARLKSLEEEKSLLETRLHKTESELTSCEIAKENLKRDKVIVSNTYVQVHKYTKIYTSIPYAYNMYLCTYPICTYINNNLQNESAMATNLTQLASADNLHLLSSMFSQFVTFLDRLSRILNMDEISKEVGIELHTESILLRTEQLVKLESGKTIDKVITYRLFFAVVNLVFLKHLGRLYVHNSSP